jgi:hypothetical protein
MEERMNGFADLLLIQFKQAAFVTDFLTNKLGLMELLISTYKPDDVVVHDVALTSIPETQFEMPAFETVRVRGMNEQIMPSPERVKVDRDYHRRGRLSWVDVYLDVLLGAKVESQQMPLDKITAQDLLAKLGPVNTLFDLRNKLGTMYTPSIVDAFFEQLRINTIEDFTNQPGLFLQFIFKEPAPFNPADPKNTRTFRINVCVQIQPELKVAEALQAAKLCRSIMENERQHTEQFDGGDISTPFSFVTVFPDSLVVDNAIGTLTATQARTGIKQLFSNEGMFAHFA